MKLFRKQPGRGILFPRLFYMYTTCPAFVIFCLNVGSACPAFVIFCRNHLRYCLPESPSLLSAGTTFENEYHPFGLGSPSGELARKRLRGAPTRSKSN